jgi:AcrR family transcriptional regulator
MRYYGLPPTSATGLASGIGEKAVSVLSGFLIKSRLANPTPFGGTFHARADGSQSFIHNHKIRRAFIMSTRGRPRQFDRDQALEVAMQLFRHHGYEGTSVSFLGEKMGINTPSLYAAFGSKDELYHEAVNLYVTKFSVPLVSELINSPCAYGGMFAFLKQCAHLFSGEGTANRGCMIASGDLVHAPSQADRAHEMSLKRGLAEEAILSRLERAQQESKIPADADIKALAGYFAIVVQGLSVRAHDGASEQDMLRVIDVAMQAWPHDAPKLMAPEAEQELAAA